MKRHLGNRPAVASRHDFLMTQFVRATLPFAPPLNDALAAP